jgi:isocitrate dehydrogenase (NAD+)
MTDPVRDVALVRGDGIGPEISDVAVAAVAASAAAVRFVDVPLGAEARRRLGEVLPAPSLDRIRQLGVALKAPLVAEVASGGVEVRDARGARRHPSANSGLRRELGLYANVRPVRGFPGVSGRYGSLDVVLVREATEDTYAGLERWAPGLEGERAEAIKLVTRAATRRAALVACAHARAHGRRCVTAVHKANVLHTTDGLFVDEVRRVVEATGELRFEDRMVDAAAYLLVKEPQRLDVLVLPNQYGDILSDVAAGLVGSLGLCPGANLGDGVAVFEAAHGAAPDIAGQGRANPLGLVLSAVMLLEHLGQRVAARRLRRGVEALLAEARCLTPDLGGRASTAELGARLCALVADAPAEAAA